MFDKEKFKNIIWDINLKKTASFTGTGLILYKTFDLLPIEPLLVTPIIKFPIDDEKKIINTMLDINQEECVFHDGFHLLNDKIELTHISYYFSTPINKFHKPKLQRGSRYRTAFYGSCLPNVLCTVVLGNDYDPIFFVNGKESFFDEF